MAGDTTKAAELLQLAQNFRLRAAEAADQNYHRMMMRTAVELEEHAQSITPAYGSGLVMIDDGEIDETEDC